MKLTSFLNNLYQFIHQSGLFAGCPCKESYYQAKLILVFIEAHELKCYTCSSTKSWEDCESTQSKKTCPEGQERCTKASTEYNGTKSYSKDCLGEASCDNKDAYLRDCKAAQNSSCILTCCPGELCNRGTKHAMGVFLLVTCVVQGLLFWRSKTKKNCCQFSSKFILSKLFHYCDFSCI